MGVAKSLRPKQEPERLGRYLSIDSSSKSIAFSIIDQDDVSVLRLVGKISLPSEMKDKLAVINAGIKALFEAYGPIDHVIIEQTIYIQSPQTSRILSYIVGHTWGKCLEFCSDVRDVEVMKWKAFIGYKNVSKAEKAMWQEELGEKEAKRKAVRERKERTGRIVKSKIAEVQHIEDDDIIDSIAIGLWAVSSV